MPMMPLFITPLMLMLMMPLIFRWCCWCQIFRADADDADLLIADIDDHYFDDDGLYYIFADCHSLLMLIDILLMSITLNADFIVTLFADDDATLNIFAAGLRLRWCLMLRHDWCFRFSFRYMFTPWYCRFRSDADDYLSIICHADADLMISRRFISISFSADCRAQMIMDAV